jgi:hypothetical protein
MLPCEVQLSGKDVCCFPLELDAYSISRVAFGHQYTNCHGGFMPHCA